MYDWRHRFGMSMRDVLDRSPDWWETLHLVRQLAGDSSSHVAAALAGHTHAWPIQAWILADLFDVTLRANSKRGRAKPYPRPSTPPPTRIGDASKHPQHVILAALAARGHDIDTAA